MTVKKLAYVTFSVSFEVPIYYNTKEELENAIQNIPIPENHDDKIVYKEDTFEFVSCEDKEGNKIDLS